MDAHAGTISHRKILLDIRRRKYRLAIGGPGNPVVEADSLEDLAAFLCQRLHLRVIRFRSDQRGLYVTLQTIERNQHAGSDPQSPGHDENR